jgi:hypothetical protein
VSLASGSWTAFEEAFKTFAGKATGLYKMDESMYPLAYSCLLLSATRKLLPDRDDAVIPMPPTVGSWTAAPMEVPSHTLHGADKGKPSDAVKTLHDAVTVSICMWQEGPEKDTREVVVPPIILQDPVFEKSMYKVPIRPSELYPFAVQENLRLFTGATLAERGQLFEKAFLAALRGRYVLLMWERRANDVPLADVLQGAISKAGRKKLEGITVNLSDGVGRGVSTYTEALAAMTSNGRKQLWWTGQKDKTAHHDAYLTAAKNGKSFPVAVQLRHGTLKLEQELKTQLLQERGGSEKIVSPLLSVNVHPAGEQKDIAGVVAVDASQMMNNVWLELLRRDTSPAKGGQELLDENTEDDDIC